MKKNIKQGDSVYILYCPSNKKYIKEIIGSECIFVNDLKNSKKFNSLNGKIDLFIDEAKSIGVDCKKLTVYNSITVQDIDPIVSYKKFLEIKDYYKYFSKRKGFIKHYHKIVYNVLKGKSLYNGFSLLNNRDNSFELVDKAIELIKCSSFNDEYFKKINIAFGFLIDEEEISEIYKRINKEVAEN